MRLISVTSPSDGTCLSGPGHTGRFSDDGLSNRAENRCHPSQYDLLYLLSLLHLAENYEKYLAFKRIEAYSHRASVASHWIWLGVVCRGTHTYRAAKRRSVKRPRDSN